MLNEARKQLESGWWQGNRHVARAIVNRLISSALCGQAGGCLSERSLRAVLRGVPECVFAGLLEALPHLGALGTGGRKALAVRISSALRFGQRVAADQRLAGLAREWIAVTSAYVAVAARPPRAEAAVELVEATLWGHGTTLSHATISSMTESQAWKLYWSAIERGEDAAGSLATVRCVQFFSFVRSLKGGVDVLLLLISQSALDEGPDHAGIGRGIIPPSREAAAEA